MAWHGMAWQMSVTDAWRPKRTEAEQLGPIYLTQTWKIAGAVPARKQTNFEIMVQDRVLGNVGAQTFLANLARSLLILRASETSS